MPRIKETKVYQFSELEDDAKEKARTWYRDSALDYEWWDCAYDDVKECLAACGFDIDEIYFSGFSSQGDGACFEGTWRAKAVNETALLQHAPQDTELHAIAHTAAGIAARYPEASASTRQKGRYFDMEIGADVNEDDSELELPNADWRKIQRAAEEEIEELCRDAAHWIYRVLEKEYEYLTSNECVDESITANEYEFTEEGERA